MMIFVDESSLDVRVTYRGSGYALRGVRASQQAYFIRGERYSVLPALSLNGIEALDIVKGSFTAETFKNFIAKLLDKMNPYPLDNSIIVMDNCRIHKSTEITDMITARGMHYLFLPPYSPDFNPIEMAFSKIKSSICRDDELARFEMTANRDDPEREANIEALFHRHVYSVTEDNAWGWYAGCGYID
ncbi:DDE superfamily endonuclease [Ceratobasidium sp. AG-Ba]|nr:DDE superfamily endonuclease [Ceratobasidium sp. AG-Ba]